MEEHICSFIANKCEASKILEFRIEKIKDTYTSGITAMKKLSDALRNKVSLDLEHLKLTVSAQTMAVENFLVTAVSEAELVLHDIENSLAEQKQLLDLSAKQQEEGLQRSLVSTQVISKTTIDFFNDLHSRASELMMILEENQIEKSHQLANFEETYQEESVREEKAAIGKIAEILATLTAKKTKMVSEAMRNINDRCVGEKIKLQKEVSEIQQVATNAKMEWNAYIEKVETQFQEDTSLASDTRATMENNLQECSKKVHYSRQQWENTEISVDCLNKGSTAEMESTVE